MTDPQLGLGQPDEGGHELIISKKLTRKQSAKRAQIPTISSYIAMPTTFGPHP
jgi:hypothetical protein